MRYHNAIRNELTALNKQYPNAIAIFGGAFHASIDVNSDKPNFENFVGWLPHVIQSAKFFKWHEGVAGALRRFCHLCYVDPALVEAYIGMTFEEVK